MLVRAIVMLLALSGCAKHPLQMPPVRDELFIHLKLVDHIPGQSGYAGFADCNGAFCRITILKSYYPECLVHEVGHGTHGPWHGDRPTNCKFGSNYK